MQFPQYFIHLILIVFLAFPQGVSAQTTQPHNVVAVVNLPVSPLLGLKLDPSNPYTIQFLFHDQAIDQSERQQRMIDYFFTALMIPPEDLWVNLSPLEPHRLMGESLQGTRLGHDLLELDLQLKKQVNEQLQPDHINGKEFWNRVYQRADRLGLADLDLELLQKVWITPSVTQIAEHQAGVVLNDIQFTVQTDHDYQAFQYQQAVSQNQYQQVLNEVLIPVLIEQVNQSEDFVQLHDIYRAIVLAQWYRKSLTYYFQELYPNSIVNQESSADFLKEIYADYLNLYSVEESVKHFDPVTQEVIEKHYFTGGIIPQVDEISKGEIDPTLATLPVQSVDAAIRAEVADSSMTADQEEDSLEQRREELNDALVKQFNGLTIKVDDVPELEIVQSQELKEDNYLAFTITLKESGEEIGDLVFKITKKNKRLYFHAVMIRLEEYRGKGIARIIFQKRLEVVRSFIDENLVFVQSDIRNYETLKYLAQEAQKQWEDLDDKERTEILANANSSKEIINLLLYEVGQVFYQFDSAENYAEEHLENINNRFHQVIILWLRAYQRLIKVTKKLTSLESIFQKSFAANWVKDTNFPYHQIQFDGKQFNYYRSMKELSEIEQSPLTFEEEFIAAINQLQTIYTEQNRAVNLNVSHFLNYPTRDSVFEIIVSDEEVKGLIVVDFYYGEDSKERNVRINIHSDENKKNFNGVIKGILDLINSLLPETDLSALMPQNMVEDLSRSFFQVLDNQEMSIEDNRSLSLVRWSEDEDIHEIEYDIIESKTKAKIGSFEIRIEENEGAIYVTLQNFSLEKEIYLKILAFVQQRLKNVFDKFGEEDIVFAFGDIRAHHALQFLIKETFIAWESLGDDKQRSLVDKAKISWDLFDLLADKVFDILVSNLNAQNYFKYNQSDKYNKLYQAVGLWLKLYRRLSVNSKQLTNLEDIFASSRIGKVLNEFGFVYQFLEVRNGEINWLLSDDDFSEVVTEIDQTIQEAVIASVVDLKHIGTKNGEEYIFEIDSVIFLKNGGLGINTLIYNKKEKIGEVKIKIFDSDKKIISIESLSISEESIDHRKQGIMTAFFRAIASAIPTGTLLVSDEITNEKTLAILYNKAKEALGESERISEYVDDTTEIIGDIEYYASLARERADLPKLEKIFEETPLGKMRIRSGFGNFAIKFAANEDHKQLIIEAEKLDNGQLGGIDLNPSFSQSLTSNQFQWQPETWPKYDNVQNISTIPVMTQTHRFPTLQQAF